MNLKIGEEKTRWFKGSDGSIPGSVGVLSNTPPGVVSIAIDGRAAIVKGVTAGSATVTYSSPNYGPVSESYDVTPTPNLVISDTP